MKHFGLKSSKNSIHSLSADLTFLTLSPICIVILKIGYILKTLPHAHYFIIIISIPVNSRVKPLVVL